MKPDATFKLRTEGAMIFNEESNLAANTGEKELLLSVEVVTAKVAYFRYSSHVFKVSRVKEFAETLPREEQHESSSTPQRGFS